MKRNLKRKAMRVIARTLLTGQMIVYTVPVALYGAYNNVVEYVNEAKESINDTVNKIDEVQIKYYESD